MKENVIKICITIQVENSWNRKKLVEYLEKVFVRK